MPNRRGNRHYRKRIGYRFLIVRRLLSIESLSLFPFSARSSSSIAGPGGVRVLALHLGRIDRRPRGSLSLRFELLGLTSFGFPVARPPAGVLDACGLRLQLLPQLVAELILNILSMVRPAVRQVNTLRSLLREYYPAAWRWTGRVVEPTALIAIGLPL